MPSFEEKRYFIDPGEGEKRDTCPSYSCFEDGRDAKSGIIPPKDHILKGFRFDPQCSDKEYNGTLYAEYEKAPLFTRLKLNYGKYVLALLGLIILFLILSALGVFNDDKPAPKAPRYVTNRIDTVVKNDSGSIVSNNSTQPDSIPVQTDINSSQTAKESVSKEEKPVDNLKTMQFKKEFWALIHNKAKQMDKYDNLYISYQGEVKGKEYDYLRSTILKSSTDFKEWARKLGNIPTSEIEDIDDINTLEKKLKEFK